ncbi:hypothetical protein KIW84_013742 [Lathyrus oleraceus]|uniref:Uncharacterized protein n=1 Tax=Pisum sativum TaxID=3888 RepID=A0A9D5BKX5_PEA|nr:hypothetical protein KIW84_013742 [Pisum sativum]
MSKLLYMMQRSQTGGSGKKACINVTLSDECGAELDVTLWELYVNQLTTYIKDNAPPVVILTHAWCRQSSSTGKLNVLNAWNGSKLLLNYDHPQVTAFKLNFEYGKPYPISLQTLSVNSASQAAFEERSFSFIKDVKTIGQIMSLKDDTTNMAIHSPNTKGKEIVTTESPVIPKALSQSCNQTITASTSDAPNWSPDASNNNTPSKIFLRDGIENVNPRMLPPIQTHSSLTLANGFVQTKIGAPMQLKHTRGRPNKGLGVSDKAYNLTRIDQCIYIPLEPATTQHTPSFTYFVNVPSLFCARNSTTNIAITPLPCPIFTPSVNLDFDSDSSDGSDYNSFLAMSSQDAQGKEKSETGLAIPRDSALAIPELE